MVSLVNRTRKSISGPIAIAILALISIGAHGQLFKKKKESGGKGSTYAYQTFSTALPKEKKKGYGGDEAKFHFEKPTSRVPFGENYKENNYSVAPYFGHKRLPKRRPLGHTKLCKVCGIKH